MNITKFQWDGFVRLLAVATALVFLVISAQFSVDGFSIEIPDKRWVGWLMSSGLIVLELVFNRMMKEAESNIKQFPILALAGLLSYIYGIYTNVVGINAFSGFEIHGFQQLLDTLKIRPIHSAIGVIFEVVPEAVLVWAITAKGSIFVSKPVQKEQQQPKYSSRDVRPEVRDKIHSHTHTPVNQSHNQPRKPSNQVNRLREFQQKSNVNFDILREFDETGELDAR